MFPTVSNQGLADHIEESKGLRTPPTPHPLDGIVPTFRDLMQAVSIESSSDKNNAHCIEVGFLERFACIGNAPRSIRRLPH